MRISRAIVPCCLRCRRNRTAKAAALTAAILVLIAVSPLRAQKAGAAGRIFVLVVWDGLRPDLVTPGDTPILSAMAREGVRFDRQHSVYPTMTMPNAAAMATGCLPGTAGILGYAMYLWPALRSKLREGSVLAQAIDAPVGLESSKLLDLANGPEGFDGHLLGLDTIAQEAEREGGYVGVAGKKGPTFLFDDRVATVKDGRDSLHMPHQNYLFAADDLTLPENAAGWVVAPSGPTGAVMQAPSSRDESFTRVVIERALPAAREASDKGHAALVLLWLRQPDAAQHVAGLGTLDSLNALKNSDANLGRVRDAIARSGVKDHTDLMVVSDHGFATIRVEVNLAGILVAAGLKKSLDSTDVVIAQSGGTDLLYLSPADFPSSDARRQGLQKIVDFSEAQEWCGPIFSREPAPLGDGGRRAKDYLGWIDGTFNQAAVGLYNRDRSPDLVISFREYPDVDNSTLTGPSHPAFRLDAQGQRAVVNRSKELVRPIKGLTYADAASSLQWTTGMGMHGAAGARELHNFCAAVGPDFRRGFVDRSPTGNADIAPTITRILGLQPNIGPGGVYATGRVMEEALNDGGRAQGAARAVAMTANRELAGMTVTTTLSATQLGRWLYLDDSSVVHVPLGRSP